MHLKPLMCGGSILSFAVKSAPKEGVLTSLFRRNYKVDMSFDTYLPLGEKDIIVVAGRIIDIKRFVED
jgi:hypothetical protein